MKKPTCTFSSVFSFIPQGNERNQQSILKYTRTRNKPSPKAQSDAYPPGSGKNAFPAGFTIQAKENMRFYAAEHTLLHNFHQAGCPVKHMVCF